MDDRFTDETPTHSLQRVLLIEDDPTYVAVAKAILQSSPAIKFHLNTAKTGAEGAQFLEQHGADVVLLDLTLPDCQGLDSFERVRSFALKIPVIVLTGVDDEELAIRAVEKGAQDYLVKSDTDPPALIRAIRYALKRKGVELALQREKVLVDQLLAEQRVLKAVINHLPDLIYATDREGRLLIANSTFYRFAGVSDEESIRGKKIDEVLSTDGAPELTSKDSVVIRDGNPVFIERHELGDPSGRRRAFSTSKIAVRGEDESVEGIISVSHALDT